MNLDEFATVFLNIFESHRLDQQPHALINTLSVDDAYAVQQIVIDRRSAKGEVVVGYKVGCTSTAIRRQFGLSEPICGRVMQPYVYYGDTVLNWHDFHRPAVEPEFVLAIGRDLMDEVGPHEPLDAAIEFVSPGIEVHNYDWSFGQPTAQELICSNGIHACLVVGKQMIKPVNLDWNREEMGLFKNGKLAAAGVGAEIMGGPLTSLRWLINHLVRRGQSLQAGQLVIPGSAVELVPIEPIDRVTASFTHIGNVVAQFQG